MGILLIPFNSNGKNPGEYVRDLKEEIGKKIGYITFLYPVGLQIIVYGEDFLIDEQELVKYVDKIDTQTVVLQSIYLIDRKQRK